MIRKTYTLAALALALLPTGALAYIEPEQVLLSRELFLPPTSREAQERTLIQNNESAARREREQARAFELQHPTVVEAPIEETLYGAAPEQPTANVIYAVPIQGTAGFPQLFGSAPAATDAASLELARTMRLLSRVNQNQTVAQFQQEVLHSGAPNLAPTGAGSILAMLTMIGAVGYTLRRAKKSHALLEAF